LPIFGLGQLFAASADPASLAWAGTLFGIYIAAALGLMATTSLLGLQRYLNGRGLELPESVSRKWMTLAATTAMIIFLILWALPKPNLESGLHSSLAFFTSKNSNPSSWALGRDGQKQGARPTSQTKGDQGKQTNQGQGKTGEGGQGEPKSSGEGTKSESKSNSSNASKSQSDSSSKSSEKSGADSKSPQPDPQSPNSKSPNAKSPPAETNKESGESKPQSPSEMRDAAQQQAAEKARENARDKNPDDQNKSAANQQDQQPNQNNSNQQKQTPPKNPDQSSGGSTNNNSPPPMNQPPMNLGPWAKWLTYLVGITALVVFAILFRRELIQLWLELLAFFQGLTGKKPAADPIAAAETNTVNRTRSKSFRDFANPFEKQTNTNFDDQQLVTYTFAAFEALGADARLDRGADETPHEFASRLARRLDALTNVARNFIDIYCQSIYGGGNLARIDRESVKSFWDAMNSANQRLQQNTNS
jgi:hypothetical protein